MGSQAEELKQLLSSKEALGIICFNKHRHQAKISCTRLSEILKIPITKIKEMCAKLEKFKVVKIHKAGPDYEVEVLESKNDEISHMIDEIIWENKQEYGKIYKKLITAELLDFMGEEK